MVQSSETELLFRHAHPSPLGTVSEAGFVRHDAEGGVKPWRVYGRYALVYLYDGAGFYAERNGVRQELMPGDLLVIRPKVGHAYGPMPGQDWQEYYLAFGGPVFDLWAKSGLLLDARPAVLHLEPVDEWLRRFRAVLGPPGQSPSENATPLGAVCRLQQLLNDILIGGAPGPQANPGDARWIARARLLLEAAGQADGIAGISVRSSVGDVARQMRLSVEGFRKRFKRMTGQSPIRYQAARRIDTACGLLSGGSMTIKATAAATGFSDEFHFSRRFKEITGESPSQFRRRRQG